MPWERLPSKKQKQKQKPVSMSNDLFGLKCSKNEMKTKERFFSGTKFRFPLRAIIVPRYLQNNHLPPRITLRYPKSLHLFQGVDTAVQKQGLSFPKTLPYHHVTGELTVNEILHVK